MADVGAGPVGLATLLTAQLHSPSQIIMVDLDEDRLEVAKQFGATHVVTADPDATAQIMVLTEERGVDIATGAVSIPTTF